VWWLRELIDWMVGGPGFTHGRRDPVDLRVGDAIDYWTVLALERAWLTLHFGLRRRAQASSVQLEALPGRHALRPRTGIRAVSGACSAGTQ
jgi:hypothetical protein